MISSESHSIIMPFKTYLTDNTNSMDIQTLLILQQSQNLQTSNFKNKNK